VRTRPGAWTHGSTRFRLARGALAHRTRPVPQGGVFSLHLLAVAGRFPALLVRTRRRTEQPPAPPRRDRLRLARALDPGRPSPTCAGAADAAARVIRRAADSGMHAPTEARCQPPTHSRTQPPPPKKTRLPFYYLAKLGFLVALWHPSTKLAAALYGKAIAPLLARCGTPPSYGGRGGRARLACECGHSPRLHAALSPRLVRSPTPNPLDQQLRGGY
jgi:hypothetical protein